ncbi:hypothetical protein N0V91_010707 [Didymella pomorum]|jgi:uncharacterized protein YbjT (DUF2867 family)|uniref:NmrA-like domain-containing protein n=1 Tax=Didymella pomorum TaxID=749634 RepID=A0A9W9CZQ8_9PLEO|nr:hypothetical protein N0V91_010707 [Didymella pomorum]
MSSDHNVLVFGPAGAVGCAAAIEAHRRGAHVWLAMRDTNKTIKGLSVSDLESKRYTKLQADLTKPDTLKKAVEQSGATTAFVYTVFESKDSMRGTFDTLKAAGIQHVVVLSSFTVKGPAEDPKNMEGFIEAAHAKTEVALKESGLASTAVRPMYFTSNVFWYTEGIRSGKVELLYPDIRFDYLSPTDIGTVAGAVLSEPRFRSQHQQVIPLCGPQLHTQREAMGIIGDTLGRKIEIQELTEDQFYEKQAKIGMPPPVIKTITAGMRKSNEGHDSYPDHAEVSQNVSKYAERDPMTLADWINANKIAFVAA